MIKQANILSIKLPSRAIIVSITIIIVSALSAFAQGKIEFNQIYDCGGTRANFKIISCKGTGKLDTCEVFNINELSPNGGYQSSVYFNIIEDTYLKRNGCKTKNSSDVRKETKENETPVTNNNQKPVRNVTNDAVACSASSEDSDGTTANEKSFRGVIRRLWEKEAREGSDGAVTITFQSVVVGAPRAWRANLSDAYSQADPRKPIYPVRAAFTTCTDYRRAVSRRKMERIYDCFVHKTGGWQCTQTGASGALALKDKEEYIQKQQ